MGLSDQSSILGLRPGEILGCINAAKYEAGCGSAMICSNCGAAIAMVSSLTEKNRSKKSAP